MSYDDTRMSVLWVTKLDKVIDSRLSPVVRDSYPPIRARVWAEETTHLHLLPWARAA